MFGQKWNRRALLGGGGALLLGGRAPAATAEIVIDEFAFKPAELRVAAGATVVWTNRDGSPHNVVSAATPPLFRSRLMDNGEAFEQVFATPGRYEYFCRLHPHMQGSIVVA